jgi:hypothetical protein
MSVLSNVQYYSIQKLGKSQRKNKQEAFTLPQLLTCLETGRWAYVVNIQSGIGLFGDCPVGLGPYPESNWFVAASPPPSCHLPAPTPG